MFPRWPRWWLGLLWQGHTLSWILIIIFFFIWWWMFSFYSQSEAWKWQITINVWVTCRRQSTNRYGYLQAFTSLILNNGRISQPWYHILYLNVDVFIVYNLDIFLLSVLSDGQVTYSYIDTFLHKQHNVAIMYKSIRTSLNETITLTGSHLIYSRKSFTDKFNEMYVSFFQPCKNVIQQIMYYGW